MRVEKRPRFFLALARVLLGLSLSLPLLLASPGEAGLTTRSSEKGGQTGPTSTPSSTIQQNQPPAAVDDGGSGFYTFKNRPFTTGNVLANDYDPDGEPLFVKSFNDSRAIGLVNYLPGGSLDITFGNGGKATTALGGFYYAGPLLIQPDNKILVAGYVNISTPQGPIDTDIALARYNPNGSLDASFNATGIVTTTFTKDSMASAIVLQPDRKILITGVVNTAFNSNFGQFGLVRYNPDGSLDPTFGSGGKVTTDFDDGGAHSSAIALQPDGKIVLAGWAYTGIPGSDYHDFAVARYNPDGSLDASFGNGGKVISGFGNSSSGQSIAIQPDGKIVVAGFSGNWPSSDFALARYNPDGSLDTSFNDSGLFTTRFTGDASGEAVAIQPDGKIVVAGVVKPYENSIYYFFGLARYNPDGSLDTHFNGNGKVTTDFGMTGYAQSLFLQPDGKMIAVGNIYDGASYNFAAARYNPDGSLDAGFHDNGKVITAFDDTYYHVSGALQPDGKIVLAGTSNHTFVLARYNAGGTFRYDPNGKFDSLEPGEQVFDNFTYTASNGILTDTATVTITVVGADQIFLPLAR